MREILRRLNGVHGIRGSLVVTPDGLPIATELPGLEAEATAGLGACMGKMITEWAEGIDASRVVFGMMDSKDARLFISPIVWGFLVAVADKSCPLGEARLEVRMAAERLNEICQKLSRHIEEEESYVSSERS